MGLNGKVAVVTGSSRGIGRAIALNLAEQGCILVVNGASESAHLDASYQEVKKHSPAAIKVVANLSERAAIDAMFERTRAEFGRVDILVNNAATQKPCPFLEVEEEEWDFILDVNLKAPFLCGQHAGRMMREQGAGKIINIASVHSHAPKRNFVHYSCSKAGIEMLTKCMAIELAEYNIQVTAIIAGAIATDMTPPDRSQNLLSSIPAGRIGAAEEIAHLVAFLSSGKSDYLTGGSIVVDGGLTLGFCASRPDL